LIGNRTARVYCLTVLVLCGLVLTAVCLARGVGRPNVLAECNRLFASSPPSGEITTLFDAQIQRLSAELAENLVQNAVHEAVADASEQACGLGPLPTGHHGFLPSATVEEYCFVFGATAWPNIEIPLTADIQVSDVERLEACAAEDVSPEARISCYKNLHEERGGLASL